MDEQEQKLKKKRFWRNLYENRAIFGYLIFWAYNLAFLIFIGLGFGPIVLPVIIQGVRAGTTPVFYVVYGAIIVAIPLIAVIMGATVFRREVNKLFLLGYGIQGPIMLILGVRFFALGQTTLPIKIIITIAVIGLSTLLWHMLDPFPAERTGWVGYLKAAGLACLLAIGFYASLWILFYTFPIGSYIIEVIVDIITSIPRTIFEMATNFTDVLRHGFELIFFLIFGTTVSLASAILFVLVPIVVPWLYLKTWWEGNRGIGRRPALGVLVGVFSLIGILLFAVDKQPQAEAFALLKTDPTTPAEARALLAQSDDIRTGLLNSYLARTRYLSAQNELDHIRWMYQDQFAVSDQTSLRIQNLYEIVARPFLYHPVEPLERSTDPYRRWEQESRLNSEPEIAADLYEKFFDESINSGEKEAVVQAVRTTWDPERAQEAWQAVDDREVLLKAQHLNHTALGDGMHGFELHEVYSNQTGLRQEVVYYFSLPETAVITGVWLGDENGKQFNYRVAPRGAAQQVYQEQVQRNVDPALVEQIGPQQYRLRVFPIDPLRQVWENDGPYSAPTLEAGEEMHMWLSWQLLEQDGEIPLPSLSVLRNVYWNDETVRMYPAGVEATADAWLPTSMASPSPQKPATHAVTFPDGRTVVASAADAVAPPLPLNLNLAIVLDRSFSMNEQIEGVKAALDYLRTVSPAADVYLTASTFRGEAPAIKALGDISADDLVFFGGQNSAEMMQQFTDLNTGEAYDAIVVLTDDGTFSTLTNEVGTVPVPAAPVWMLHLGDVLPNGYDDNTLEVIQASGGGTATSLYAMSTRLAVSLAGEEADIIDGFRWRVYPAGSQATLPADSTTHSSDSPFGKIAARQLILAEMRANRGSITDVALLDGLHAIAVDQAIVTPFSSMIVLVNQAQEKRLDELEKGADRFEREVEAVGDTAPGPTVTGVPEPEEWLLIILAVGMLVWFFWKKRQPETFATLRV